VRVAVDIRRITEFGVGTYTRNAIRTLARLDHENEYLLIGIPDNIGPGGWPRSAAADFAFDSLVPQIAGLWVPHVSFFRDVGSFGACPANLGVLTTILAYHSSQSPETSKSMFDQPGQCAPTHGVRQALVLGWSMPSGLERWHGGHDLHFITFSCYQRQPLLASARRRDLFLKVLERVRQRYRWVVMGYVVMPEHVHLLVSEPQQGKLAIAMQALKLGFARRVLAEQRRRERCPRPDLFEHRLQRVWQARYFDFNVRTTKKRVEKLRYLHRNPVKRGLVEAPEQWRWSSFRAYAYQETGPVGVNEWGAPELKSRAVTTFAR